MVKIEIYGWSNVLLIHFVVIFNDVLDCDMNAVRRTHLFTSVLF